MHRRMLPLCTHLRIAFTHDVEEKGVDIVVEVLVVQKHLGQVAQVLAPHLLVRNDASVDECERE